MIYHDSTRLVSGVMQIMTGTQSTEQKTIQLALIEPLSVINHLSAVKSLAMGVTYE
jgi:hypothetical protein